jgi:Na+-driven multidrug efflux pump
MKLSALYVNRQVYLAVLLYIPQALLLYFWIEWVFESFGIEKAIAETAALYVKICLPGHLFLNISNCFQKFLSAQREVRLQMGSYIIEFFVHNTLAYVLVVIYKQGVFGLALVTSFDYFLRFVTLQVFIYFSRF